MTIFGEKKMQTELSVNEKASKLNRLRKLMWTGTPCEAKITISDLFDGYNKENNIIIDSAIWQIYGIHYKEYIDTSLASCGICTYDVIKLEQAIDKGIEYLEKELLQDKAI